MGSALSIFQKINVPASLKDMQKFTSRMNKAFEELYDKVYGYIELSDMAKSTQKIINAKTDTAVTTQLKSEINDAFSELRQTMDKISLIVQETTNAYSSVTQTRDKWAVRVYDKLDVGGTNLVINGAPGASADENNTPSEWLYMSEAQPELILGTAESADGTPKGHYVEHYVEDATPGAETAGFYVTHDPLESAGAYTISLYARMVQSTYSTCEMRVGVGGNEAHACALTSEFQQFKWTFTAQAASERMEVRYLFGESAVNPSFASVQIHSVIIEAGDTFGTIAWSEYINAADEETYTDLAVTKDRVIVSGAAGGTASASRIEIEPDAVDIKRVSDGASILRMNSGALATGNGVAAGFQVVVLLHHEDWTDGYQHVDIEGLDPDAVIFVGAYPASREDVEQAGIYSEGYESGGIGFYCEHTPSADVLMNVYAEGGIPQLEMIQ